MKIKKHLYEGTMRVRVYASSIDKALDEIYALEARINENDNLIYEAETIPVVFDVEALQDLDKQQNVG